MYTTPPIANWFRLDVCMVLVPRDCYPFSGAGLVVHNPRWACWEVIKWENSKFHIVKGNLWILKTKWTTLPIVNWFYVGCLKERKRMHVLHS